ncbi:hypothetical protein U1Q18_024635 [Sarracenia purpurea var. burkii]
MPLLGPTPPDIADLFVEKQKVKSEVRRSPQAARALHPVLLILAVAALYRNHAGVHRPRLNNDQIPCLVPEKIWAIWGLRKIDSGFGWALSVLREIRLSRMTPFKVAILSVVGSKCSVIDCRWLLRPHPRSEFGGIRRIWFMMLREEAQIRSG